MGNGRQGVDPQTADNEFKVREGRRGTRRIGGGQRVMRQKMRGKRQREGKVQGGGLEGESNEKQTDSRGRE